MFLKDTYDRLCYSVLTTVSIGSDGTYIITILSSAFLNAHTVTMVCSSDWDLLAEIIIFILLGK